MDSDAEHIGAIKDALLGFLPFSPQEIATLTNDEEFTAIDSGDWYEHLSSDGLLLVERWRRQLSLWFAEDDWDNPESPGNRLARLVATIKDPSDPSDR